MKRNLIELAIAVSVGMAVGALLVAAWLTQVPR